MFQPAVFCTFLGLASSFAAFSQSASVASQVQSHLRQAQEFLKTEKPDLAINEFKEVLRLQPTNIEARNGLGTLLYFRGDYEGSTADLRMVLKANPTL